MDDHPPDAIAPDPGLGALIPRDTGTEETDHDLDRWLDSRESVVYTAFGTIMRLTPRQIQAILDAAARAVSARRPRRSSVPLDELGRVRA
jgi:hypothetical protein